ncbi:MAG: type VII secretion protein EssC, partial [Clostridia bacterium]|nr:type VII secretion protein EssC [Clostridia bacterium]
MIVNLIKPQQMYSLTLPNKIKGQYWIMDTDDNDRVRELLSVEAADGEWIVKSNKYVTLLDGDNRRVESLALRPQSFINLKLADRDDRVILFAESVDPSRQTFYKIAVRGSATFTVGRTADNHLCYENRLVSGNHAKLSYDGNGWFVSDTGSTNGTYVNGYRVTSQALYAGDFLYIMGLKIIIGQDYLAVNNPDGLLSIRSDALGEYRPQVADGNARDAEETEKHFFYRSPRFFREIAHAEFTIDPPPQLPKQDTVPLALMLGPSITMGLTSLSTGILSLTNVLAQGGEIAQALPSLLMSVSMLLGTILWPILTKRHETKVRIQNERKRQEKYLDYLEQIRDDIKRKTKEQSDILNENRISPAECAARITGETTNLWERSIGHNDFLRLRLGLGKLPLDATVNCQEKRFTMEDDALQDAMLSLWAEPKQLTNVPITVSMVENNTVGIYGDDASANHLLKSLILQMVALHGYDELKIMLVTDGDREGEWHFTRCLPHLWSDDKSVRFFATSADEVKELSAYIDQNILTRGDDARPPFTELLPYYVLIFVGKSLSEKCEALQKLLDYKNNRGFSVLFVTPELKDLPKETKLVISAEGRESRMFDRDDTAEKGVCFQMDVFDEEAMEKLAQKIANIELDMGSQRYALPDMVTFLEMFRVGKIEHLNSLTRWKENNPTITLQTPIGVDAYGGLFHLDLHEKYHGPHGLVAGMTGSGKSEFIITFILSLAVNYHPDEVAFILIDYKGGGLTGAFEDPDRGVKLPHLAGCITNLDGAAVKRSLISIQSELRRRQAIFNEARRVSNEGTMDIYKYQKLYRDKVVTEPVPHLFIISDEFAELKTQQPEFMEQLISAARIGRSLGVHLILATQKPSGVVDDQIWSNSKFRVCLKVQEKADSQDMIKCPDAAELSQTGRFYLQVGFNELFALGQSAWCGAEYVPSETVEKPVDESVQVVDNLGRVMLSVKPEKKRALTESRIKQIVAIVKYLSNLAAEESITVRPLWLDPIPATIYVDALEEKYGVRSRGLTLSPVVGEYDDPFNQKQGVLTVPFSVEGNCLIYGATGNGKTTFLTTLAYSLLKNHTADELNLYIMDYGSETLKVFEKAPQVGGVMLSADEEKTVNFLKMLHREMEKRRNLFSEFGGDYAGYCRNSGKSVPNIVVLINNYSGFAEQFEDWQEELTLLTRDGVKYGIYFAVTAGSTNAVRYKMQQNFRTMLTMQLNDATDYTVVVGKTDGLIPSKHKGRGLVALERVYEFQTAC